MVWNKRKAKITWDKKLTATYIKCKFHEVDKWSPNRGSLIIVNVQHFELFSGNNCTFVISCPFFRSKTNDLTSLEEKLQNQAKASKQETQKKQDDILAKEKQIQQLVEKSKDLERRVAEFTNARSVEEEKQANSYEELKVTLCLKYDLLCWLNRAGLYHSLVGAKEGTLLNCWLNPKQLLGLYQDYALLLAVVVRSEIGYRIFAVSS